MSRILLDLGMLDFDGGLGNRMDGQACLSVQFPVFERGSVDHSCFPYEPWAEVASRRSRLPILSKSRA
jgi:hypothetical protein